MFRRPAFERDFHENLIPEHLLNAMFAVSSRFVPMPDINRVFGPFVSPWDDFARASDQQSHHRLESNEPIYLNDIKTACLLALHEYTTYPGRKAWMYVRRVVAISIGARLHRVDCVKHPLHLSNVEREEWRFVWWTVFRLDSTINVVAVTPFALDSLSTRTALVSTSVVDFTNDNIHESTQTFLPTDPLKSWSMVHELQCIDPGEGSHIYLLAVSMMRAVSECFLRRQSISTPEIQSCMESLRSTFSCFRLALPGWYFDATRQLAELPEAHLRRLETLIMLNV